MALFEICSFGKLIEAAQSTLSPFSLQYISYKGPRELSVPVYVNDLITF